MERQATDALIRVEQRIHSIHDTYAAASDACQTGGEWHDGMGVAMPREERPIAEESRAAGDPNDILF